MPSPALWRLLFELPIFSIVGDAAMNVCEVIRMLEDDGWGLVGTRGSHRQYKHLVKPGRVTVAGKASDDLAPGTLNSILKQAGLRDTL
jgi:predicted RNA binding protein YcfA (HicA-like mRNA interferase family)